MAPEFQVVSLLYTGTAVRGTQGWVSNVLSMLGRLGTVLTVSGQRSHGYRVIAGVVGKRRAVLVGVLERVEKTVAKALLVVDRLNAGGSLLRLSATCRRMGFSLHLT